MPFLDSKQLSHFTRVKYFLLRGTFLTTCQCYWISVWLNINHHASMTLKLIFFWSSSWGNIPQCCIYTTWNVRNSFIFCYHKWPIEHAIWGLTISHYLSSYPYFTPASTWDHLRFAWRTLILPKAYYITQNLFSTSATCSQTLRSMSQYFPISIACEYFCKCSSKNCISLMLRHVCSMTHDIIQPPLVMHFLCVPVSRWYFYITSLKVSINSQVFSIHQIISPQVKCTQKEDLLVTRHIPNVELWTYRENSYEVYAQNASRIQHAWVTSHDIKQTHWAHLGWNPQSVTLMPLGLSQVIYSSKSPGSWDLYWEPTWSFVTQTMNAWHKLTAHSLFTPFLRAYMPPAGLKFSQ